MIRSLLPCLCLALPSLAAAQEKITWQDHIRPIFENRCNNCHNADKKKGDLDLSTFAGVIAGGSGGSAVEAGDSAASTLWKVVSHTAEPVMPPKGDKIPQAEIDLIAKWIAGGLLDSPDSTARVKKKASFAMSATASTARPEGPPPMPEHLLLDPVVTPERPNAVVALAHSPWAPLTALAAPRQVLLYHSVTGELQGVLPFPDDGTPETLSFSRNGALLLAGGGIAGKQGTIVVWEIKTGNPMIHLTVKEDSDTILAADISADLSKVAVGGPGRRVRIYDTRTSQLLANIKKHTDWVTTLSFSPDGVLLASGDRNGGLYVWESATGSEFHNLRGHEKMIASMAWRSDSNLLAAGSEDGTFTWWEMANGTQVKKIGSHGGVLALGFGPDGRLVSGGRDGHVRIWDANGTQQRDWVPSNGNPVLKSTFSDDGKRVLTGSWDGEVKSWDAAQAEAPPTLLVANPPSIDSRLAVLIGEQTANQEALSLAAAAVAEKEKLVASHEPALDSLRTAVAGLTSKETEAMTRVAELHKEKERMEKSRASFANQLAALQIPPETSQTPPSGAGNAPPLSPEIQSAVDQAAAAEVTLDQISNEFVETKKAALNQAMLESEASLKMLVSESERAAADAQRLKAERSSMAAKLAEEEKAREERKTEVAATKAAMEQLQQKGAATSKSLAYWQAAKLQKTAQALRTEARLLKEKLDSLREDLVPLEATVSTGSDAQAQQATELRQQLNSLPAEWEAKQQSAEAAWQAYLAQLPKP